MKLKLSKRAIAALVAGVLLVGVAIAIFAYLSGRPQTVKVVLGTGSSAATFKLEKVTTSAALATGLSGRPALAQNSGMLFDFEGGEAQRCIWMKDMQFNIDAVWVDAGNRITSIIPKLTPATYPQSYCANGQYVIELPAGEAAARGLRLGQILDL